MTNERTSSSVSRRGFLATGGTLAAAATLWTPGAVHAAENSTIKIVLVGCGGRGSGAIRQALKADPQTKVWAVADAFEDRAKNIVQSLKQIAENGELGKDQVDVTPERVFVGLDAYQKAIDTLSPGDVVILATPPAFRPLHFEYAVGKDLHVFAEKPVAVDVPGLNKIREIGKIAAKKGLKVAVGLNNRHYLRTEETIKAIHDGKLGDIVTCWVYRSQQPHRLGPVGDFTPLQHQIRNIFCYDWLTGSFIVDALIHNLDICCWAKQQWPVAAQGVGGRIARTDKDQLIDFGAIEYIFADGKKMMLQTRTMPNVWHFFQANIQGTQGCTQVGEGVRDPRIYKGFDMVSNKREVIWEPTTPNYDSYQKEHDRFFDAIRKDIAWNEIERSVEATYVAVLGRMAMETGQYITAEKGWTSKFQYAPNVASLTMDGDSPVMPDKDGNYFMPIPGQFNFS